jgi:hypothetical protein
LINSEIFRKKDLKIFDSLISGDLVAVRLDHGQWWGYICSVLIRVADA